MELDAAAIISSQNPVNVDQPTPEQQEAEQKAEASAIVQTEAPKPEEEKHEFLSPKFALLAKEQKRLADERKRIQEDRKNPEFQEFLEYKKLKASAKSDPLTALEKLGLTYDELTDYVISGKHTKDPAIRTLEEKIAKMDAERVEREKKVQEELKEAQLNQFKSEIKEECLKASDELELVNIYQAHNLVYNVIQEYYDKTEKVMPIQEAAKKVEAYLEEESKKYQGSKKLRRLFGVVETEDKQKEFVAADEIRPSHSMSTTLSNSTSTGTTSVDDDGDFDPHVLVQKAAKLLQR